MSAEPEDNQLAELNLRRAEIEAAIRAAYEPPQVWNLYCTLRSVNAEILQIQWRSVLTHQARQQETEQFEGIEKLSGR